MQPHFSLFSLTLLIIDLSACGGDQDTDKHAIPWQSKYTIPEEDSDIDYHETWGEGRGLHSAAPGLRDHSGMVDYPAVVVGLGQDLYDPNTDTYVGQSEGESEHTARHHPRHLHNNRRRHVRDQDAVSSNSMVLEESTGDSLVTMDPHEETIDTSNCTLCAVREASKQYRLEQIRKEILEKLRIERLPNITDKRLPQIPEISEWLSNFGENQWDTQRPNDPDEPVVRIISMLNLAQDPPASKQLPKMENVCYFEFHPDVEPADIISATLGVFLRPVKYETNIVTMFLVYKVKPRRRGNPIIKRKRVRLNAEDTNKWYRFNVDTVVKNWVRNSANNYGLQIMVYDGDGESLAIVEPANSTEKLFKPYIELDIREKRANANRDRRMLSLDCTEDSTTKSCCRYPMTLDFSGMGWDWVLAPKSVKVNYCSGECDVSYLTSPYQHFLNQNNSTEKQMIAACCIPKVYSGIKMMYFSEQDRIEIGVVNDIVVEKCGCT